MGDSAGQALTQACFVNPASRSPAVRSDVRRFGDFCGGTGLTEDGSWITACELLGVAPVVGLICTADLPKAAASSLLARCCWRNFSARSFIAWAC